MRKSYFAFTIFLALSLLNARAQTIPNASFEHWSTVDGVECPVGWGIIETASSSGAPPAVCKTTDKYDSSYALVLETRTVGAHKAIQTAQLFTDFSQKLTYLNGYYKSLRVGSDSAFIRVSILDTILHKLWGEAELKIFNNVSSYTSFTLPIVYDNTPGLAAHLAEIIISSDVPGWVGMGTIGDKLWIDKLFFSDFPLNIENQFQPEDLIVYPNPVVDKMAIQLPKGKNCTILLKNPLGQILQTNQSNTGLFELDISTASPGLYIIVISSSKGSTIRKVVKK